MDIQNSKPLNLIITQTTLIFKLINNNIKIQKQSFIFQSKFGISTYDISSRAV